MHSTAAPSAACASSCPRIATISSSLIAWDSIRISISRIIISSIMIIIMIIIISSSSSSSRRSSSSSGSSSSRSSSSSSSSSGSSSFRISIISVGRANMRQLPLGKFFICLYVLWFTFNYSSASKSGVASLSTTGRIITEGT